MTEKLPIICSNCSKTKEQCYSEIKLSNRTTEKLFRFCSRECEKAFPLKEHWDSL